MYILMRFFIFRRFLCPFYVHIKVFTFQHPDIQGSFALISKFAWPRQKLKLKRKERNRSHWKTKNETNYMNALKHECVSTIIEIMIWQSHSYNYLKGKKKKNCSLTLQTTARGVTLNFQSCLDKTHPGTGWKCWLPSKKLLLPIYSEEEVYSRKSVHIQFPFAASCMCTEQVYNFRPTQVRLVYSSGQKKFFIGIRMKIYSN